MSSIRYFAVIGLNFGDEGKGKIVNSLCSQHINNKPVVVRYSGGSQAGHTVITKEGKRHVFNSLGSGTLQNVPTYWASTFLINPAFIIEEIGRLIMNCNFTLQKGMILCNLQNQVITPYDIILNRLTEENRCNFRHGSCGQGIHETKARIENGISLTFEDCLNPTVRDIKLDIIKDYFNKKVKERNLIMTDKLNWFFCKLLGSFIYDINLLNSYIKPFNKSDYNTFILESSQGMLLDEKYGFFPYVTHSKLGKEGIKDIWPEITRIVRADNLYYYIPYIKLYVLTRAYLTRHGAGPLPGEIPDFAKKFLTEEDQTNIYNDWQQNFRYALLNIDLLNYSLNNLEYKSFYQKVLVVNHIDQLKDPSIFPKKEIESLDIPVIYSDISGNIDE